MSNFNNVPSVRFRRSKFDLSHGSKMSMSLGRLYPVDVQEILPGDSFKTNIGNVSRVTSSFLKPVIDNIFMDVYSFFVPLRLINEDNERVFGNPNPSAYIDEDLRDMPTNKTAMTITEKTIGDYLGLVPGVTYGAGEINLLPFRAFALVYDQWFRNENVIDEIYVQKSGVGADSEIANNNEFSPNNYMGKLPFVAKKKDYFTACLPNTQKGSIVKLPLGATAPVLAGSLENNLSNSSPLSFRVKTGDDFSIQSADSYVGTNNINGNLGLHVGGAQYVAGAGLYPANLFADLSDATASNVNDLRFAFQMQKMLERDALYGSRYNEYLLGHFGVYSPDSRLQFTECLGGGRIPINIQQVAQTSQGTEESPLANVAGYSWSNGSSRYSKGFTEHGYILTVACLRQMHTYQQGVPKMFLRKNRNDIYDPLFANLGEQPVYTSELFVEGDVNNPAIDLKGQVFGYNEAWAEYRYNPSRVCGEMRSSATNTLDIWHFADKYDETPYLAKDFIEETPSFVDRALSVPSTSQDQFIVDWWFDKKAIRVMPTYSVPGLIDHH